METPKTTRSRMATINDEQMDVRDKVVFCETPMMAQRGVKNNAAKVLYYNNDN